MIEQKNINYKYRWVVLFLFFFVNMVSNILLVSFAPVTSHAMKFYSVDEFKIVFLSLIFLIVYIPVTFLASWIIDKYDFKIGAGIGAVFNGVFGFLRFFAGDSYMLVLIFQIGLAFSQPFLLNSITKLSANWFSETERTTATSISVIAIFIGIALGMVLTPLIVIGIDFQYMLFLYGILGLIAGGLFVIFAKSKPSVQTNINVMEREILMFQGLKKLFSNRNYLIIVITNFLAIGILNMIITYIELILIPRGFNSVFAGFIGMLLIIGGIVGTILMSIISDKLNKRKYLMIFSLTIASISLLIFSFVSNEILLMISSFFFGFGLMGSGPIGLEYAVDATKPVPEGLSSGILMLSGAVGGIVLIVSLGELKISGDYFPALIIQTIFLAFCVFLSLFIEEFQPRKG